MIVSTDGLHMIVFDCDFSRSTMHQLQFVCRSHGDGDLPFRHAEGAFYAVLRSSSFWSSSPSSAYS